MNIGMCACGGIYCKYCGDPYRAPQSVDTTSTSANVFATSADHGISPVQLREKVEALEHRIALAHSTSEVARIAFETMKDRLDAALKRIVELERQVARLTAQQTAWRGVNRYEAPIDGEDV